MQTTTDWRGTVAAADRPPRSAARLLTVALAIAFSVLCWQAVWAAPAWATEKPNDVEAPEVEVVGGAFPRVGEALHCNSGTWEYSSSFTYEWLRNGTIVESRTSPTYLLTKADHDTRISCMVFAHNGTEEESEESYNSLCVEGPCQSSGNSPANVAPPKIEPSSGATIGQTLTCSTGTWSGEPRPTYTYEWLQEGVAVGEPSSSYLVTSSNAGHTLQCRVTATNTEGHASAPSNTVKVKGTAPSLESSSSVRVLGGSATAELGEKLTCSHGKWSGAPTPTFSYVWLRTLGSKTTAVAGAAAETYVVQEADEGGSLSCEVTASNLEGKASAKSTDSVPVGESAPEARTPPEIAGSAVVGAKLTCAPGEWRPNTAALEFKYGWLRDGIVVAEKTNTYTVAQADQAHTLTCEVIATNGAKKPRAAVSAGLYIPGTAPKDEQRPTITGTAAVGHELSCSPGAWSGTPTPGFTYQWLLEGEAIKNATGSSYTVPEGDQLKSLACEVTAKNSEGKASARSEAKTVSGTAPSNTSPPTVSGARSINGVLTCAHGSWTGVPTPTYTYEWVLVEAEGGRETVGSTPQYQVPSGDAGRTLICVVTAENSAGKGARESEVVVIAKTEGKPPHNTAAPSVSAPAGEGVGDEIVCSPGKWSVEPSELSFVYEWLRGEASIEGASSAKYAITPADQGLRLSCRVVATDSFGSGSASSSNSLSIPAEPPSFKSAPKIEGAPQVGETLRCSVAAPNGEPAPKLTYQWLAEGKPIASGATAPSFLVPTEDAEVSITCEVTAQNAGGKATKTSSAVKIAGSPPLPKAHPTIAGTMLVGETLECINTTWEGAPAPSFSYVWLRNGIAASKPSAGDTYIVSEADQGRYLSCMVTAHNPQGEDSAVSAPMKVPGVKPANVAAPEISGSATPGSRLSCSAGAWSGGPAPEEFHYQWLENGTPILGAEEDDLLVEPEYIGQKLACEVQAVNLVGEAKAVSATLEITSGSTEPEMAQPKIEVAEVEGREQLTCVPQDVKGTPKPEERFQWLRGSNVVKGQAAATYFVGRSDEGYNVTCEVIATNVAGEASATSPAVHVPGVAPTNTAAPQVSGQPYVGEVIYCNAGSWNAAPKGEYSYEWFADGSAIPGAKGNQYLLEGAQLGQSVSCKVTVSNGEGSASALSPGTAAVAVKPVHKFEPNNETPNETPLPKVHPQPKGPTAAQILAALETQLSSAEKGAHILALLKKGSYSFGFSAMTAGTLQFAWYEVPKGARISSKKKPLLVAAASVSFTSAARNSVKLHLTSAGRRLIRASKRVKLTAKAVFSPSAQSPVTWLESFVLSR